MRRQSLHARKTKRRFTSSLIMWFVLIVCTGAFFRQTRFNVRVPAGHPLARHSFHRRPIRHEHVAVPHHLTEQNHDPVVRPENTAEAHVSNVPGATHIEAEETRKHEFIAKSSQDAASTLPLELPLELESRMYLATNLYELLKRDSLRGDENMQTRCITNTNSLWSVRNEQMMHDVMLRIKQKQPWGWLRFADGDMNQLDKSELGRFRDSISAWPSLPNLVVSVGEWWLCVEKFKQIWARHMQTERLTEYVFHAGTFYLPAGTPDDDDVEMWRTKGIGGWVRTALDSNVTVAFVGPLSLSQIPWLTSKGWEVTSVRSRFVDAMGVSDHADRMDTAIARIENISLDAAPDPVLFVFSAGYAAKTMITELMGSERPTAKDMFVDAGTMLDGFAGVESRDFNKGPKAVKKYCWNIVQKDPERIKFWLDPGKLTVVCKGVDIGFLSSEE